jgi:exopolysaccharide biosynthesis protein
MLRTMRRIALVLTVATSASALAAPCLEPEIVATGLKHIMLCRGEASTTITYRILLGVFKRQSDADEMLSGLRSKGIQAALDADGSEYRIYTAGVATRDEASNIGRHLEANGYTVPPQIEEVRQDLTHADGPWRINVLEADPKMVEVRVAHAYDAAIGLETTAALAERHGALAAINGGYFSMEGLLAGDSRGTLRIDGRVLSEPDRGRASVGFFDRNGVTRAVFGRLSLDGEIRFADGAAVPFDGINRQRERSEIIVFTPDFHRTTLTPPGGTEVIVREGRVTEVRKGVGSSVIPSTGLVLSIGAGRTAEVVSRLRPGEQVSVETKLVSLLPDPDQEWRETDFIVSGGPLLLWKGKRLEEPEKEAISRVFFLARHPRTAVGVRADGTLLFVTVDGRRPEESVGMSLPELTDLMLELGCVSAINLDGGGSTTMVIEGNVVNRPSGGSARRNADAILLYPRKNEELGIRNWE